MEEEKIDLQDDAKPRKNKLLIVFIIVTPLLLGLLIAVLVLLYTGGPEDSFFHDPVGETQPDYIEPTREFQVNLADEGGRRFLRTTIHFGFDERSLHNELESRQEEIRSEIIALLRSKTVDDMQEPGGMNALGEDIIDTLNDILVTGELKTIYFTEFIFQ